MWRRYKASWVWPAVTFATGLATVIIAGTASPDDETPAGWFLVVVVGAILLVGGLLSFGIWLDERDIRLNPEGRQRRVRELSTALERALRTVGTIKAEIEEGDQLLAELERRTTTSRELADLNDAQVIAVTEQLRRELRGERRMGLLRDAIFFGLGVVITLIFR
jgi:4-amino-4-deoxy-L-arabinose transferase-like glycosyltransferase